MTTPVTEADVARLRELLAKAKLPWLYRPDKYDDWGFIRGPEEEMSFGIARPVVAIARGLDGDETFAQHRADKTDPYEPYGQLIVAAVNALPAILDQLEAKAASVGWEGIESAPFDKMVLVDCDRWDSVVEAIQYRNSGWHTFSFNGLRECRPIAWQHMPARSTPTPPEDTDKSGDVTCA